MRKLLSVFLFLLASATSAMATQLGPLHVIAGQTLTEYSNGQEIKMTSVGVTVIVAFSEISATRVSGTVWRDDGVSGTFTITWVNRKITKSFEITPSQPERQFSLEGGDGDKRDTGQVGKAQIGPNAPHGAAIPKTWASVKALFRDSNR